MKVSLSIGLMAEGRTDHRFFLPIIEKVLGKIIDENNLDIELKTIQILQNEGDTFIEKVKNAASIATKEYGIHILCIHVDADAENEKKVIKEKMNPAIEFCKTSTDIICKNFVAIIPIYMTESWMLADKDLLRYEIGTKLNDTELGWNKKPETISQPKDTINKAIKIALSNDTKRKRNKLEIGELYDIVGAKIKLEKLEVLPSFQRFEKEVRIAFDKFLSTKKTKI